MRPLKLTLKGWGPYRDTQSVDFTPLQDGGLFLITGPTGAGKTTIFDGIAFALYGQVSGNIRETDSLRSDFAAPAVPTQAELVFSHQGKEYRVVRSPRYERPKLRGTGTTTENEAGSLYGEEGLIVSGSQQVTGAVTELLGMDYRQFRQISMIAQGEFQQLLTASSRERTLAFRDIFRTRLYDTITQLLAREVKERSGQLDELGHRMEETAAAFRCEEEGWEELFHQKNRNYFKLADWVRRETGEKEAVQTRLSEEMEQLDREYKKAVQQVEKIRQNNRLIDQYLLEKQRIEEKKQELSQLQEKRQSLEEKARELPERRQALEAAKEALKQLKEQYQRAKDWAQESKKLLRLQEEYLAFDREWKQKKREYEAMEDRFYQAAAGILAAGLTEGAPCPVCGSLSHPAPAALSGEMPDEKQLEQKKNELERWQEKTAQAQARAAASFGAKTQLEQSLGDWANRLQTSEAEPQVLREMEQELGNRQTQVTDEQTAIERLERACQEIRLQEETRKAALLQAEENLKKPASLKKQDTEEVNCQVQELERRRRQIGREREQLQAVVTANRRGLKQLEQHMEKRASLEAEYGIVRMLERAASGSNGRKLVLEQYVLSVYFEEILQAANLRLRAMTGDRYELYRMETGRDRRMKEGMELEVLDQYTGKRRSVKTLSGGETFKASLSLALGTSDVVQSYAGGIQVETLFVDEGFGALDGESLSQAVDILASLGGDRRMIGIISHVEELQERISRQIVVEKQKNGSSIRTNFQPLGMLGSDQEQRKHEE